MDVAQEYILYYLITYKTPEIKSLNTMEQIPGKIANKYQIGKKIGAGSFGEIFAGVNLETKEEIAVKIVNNLINYLFLLFHIIYVIP